MKVRLCLLLLSLLLIDPKPVTAQDEIRPLVELQVDFNNENGNVQLKIENKNQDLSKPVSVNLTDVDLRIRFLNYTKSRLVKLYTESKLECDGLELHIDSNAASTSVQITGGELNLGLNYPVGSSFSVVIPDKSFRFSINTSRESLSVCPSEVGENTPKGGTHRIGIPYYDALYLKDGADLAVKKEILNYYAGLQRGIGSCQQILDSLRGNEFLFGYAQQLCAQISGTAFEQGTLSISTVFSSISGLDVTTIANGISMFMIRRAKEELTIGFFNHFKTFVATNSEFQVLFPKTTENLANLLAYRYPEMLPALRSGFFEDLDKITYRLDDVLELPRYAELLYNFPEIRVTIRSLRLVHEIESGDAHPADILNRFADLPEWKENGTTYDFRNFGAAVKLASIFSKSVRNEPQMSGDPTRAWVALKDVRSLITDNETFKIYLGLLYQEVRKTKIAYWLRGRRLRLDSLMIAQQNNIFLFEMKLTEFIELAAKVDKVKNDLLASGKNNNPLKNEDYYTYINTSIDVIEYGFSIANLFHPEFKGTEYTRVARNCNDLYRHIYKQEYSQAVTNAMNIYTGIRDLLNRNKERMDSSMQLSASVFSHFITRSRKYALFMANMANAESAEEVDAILENAVLPVGSSSIKKNSDFNISVQSYLGAYARFGGLKYRTNSAWSDKVGVSAPIGVTVSVGFERKGSISLFASFFDLGAIVDYRLKNDTLVDPNGVRTNVVEKDYKVELGQIISPGAYLVYGFGLNLPLSLGIGGQWGPGLSRVRGDATSVVNNPQWRWNVIFGVDIPFFTLRNKMKNYKEAPDVLE